MPSSYTTNLRLELQATGENRTTWGSLANQVFSDVDAAIAGRVNIAMSDANYTLTANNGTPDEARYMILNVTGALTATRAVIVPSVSKVYLVENNTTGSQSLNVRTSTSSTQAVVPPGKKILIACNGSVCYLVSEFDFTTNNTWTGTNTFNTGAATPVTLDRTGSATNTTMALTTTSGTVHMGHGAANTFAVKGDANLAASPWMAITSTSATFAGSITATSASITGALGTTGNITITSTGPTLQLNDSDTVSLAHMIRSFGDYLTLDADVNNTGVGNQIRGRIGGTEYSRLEPLLLSIAGLKITDGIPITATGARFTYTSASSTLALDRSDGGSITTYSGLFKTNTGITGSGSNLQGAALGLGSTALNVFSSDGSTAVSINRMTSNGICTSFRMDATQVGNISVTGSNTTYNTSSDERLKTFIGFYDPDVAIGLIRADPVRTYTWNVDGEAGIGWGAQTSYAINPAFATPGSGNPGEEDFNPWSMDYGRRVPFLWAALSKALDKVDELEARIVALENA